MKSLFMKRKPAQVIEFILGKAQGAKVSSSASTSSFSSAERNTVLLRQTNAYSAWAPGGYAEGLPHGEFIEIVFQQTANDGWVSFRVS